MIQFKGENIGSHHTLEIAWDNKNLADAEKMNRVLTILDEQITCHNCKNCYFDYYDTLAWYCEIKSMEKGNLWSSKHPHHDFDASKCEYYERR